MLSSVQRKWLQPFQVRKKKECKPHVKRKPDMGYIGHLPSSVGCCFSQVLRKAWKRSGKGEPSQMW